MREYLNKERVIVASALVRNGKTVLIARSTSMPVEINDTEYYSIPSWEVPFGYDPTETLKEALQTMLDVSVDVLQPLTTRSYLRDNESDHVVEIVYEVNVTKSACKHIQNCTHMLFIKQSEIDDYIFSDKIKQMIKTCFV